ncbi:MAG: hypothetical protein A2Z51_09440 [Deltaproteobacteria bacterium RBG_19FT_COMBO_52_11]|nr:MAG: hypothetical protein A2Z51_09440 [Deltaproteobacteria bacterium RBG_19FT_COMBO_52_11]
MSEQRVMIDAHVHTYPNAAIGRQALGSFGYGYSGTVEELQEVMRQGNFSYAIMANMTPIQEMLKVNIAGLPASLPPEQKTEAIKEVHKKVIERMQRRNQWTCESAQQYPGLIALVSVDVLQSPEQMVEELAGKVMARGAKGLKLHPIASEYYPWDQRLWPVYAQAQALKIPVLWHSGASELPGYDSRYAQPRQFAKVAQAFPELTMVLAHLGKGYFEESIELARKYANVFFDLSGCFFSSGTPPSEHIQKIGQMIKQIGPHRILYGSDWPWFDPLGDVAVIEKMDFSDEEKAMILGLNAKRIYNL